ncbi:MAG: 3-deoxy-D-manno-octulosonic acid transferase [Armatimonadetes bacterium]|nr:3-deoxy-D-manno-octulosonic acid transferase [Armatimonadota bacterium]
MPPLAWWLVYNLLHLLALPVLLGWLLYRKLAQGKGEGWAERMGGSPALPPDSPAPVWVHAVSAGEAAAAAPLLKALEERLPDVPILLTTLTPAGKEMAARLCPQASALFYFPWDLLPAVHRSLNRTRPRAVLLMEAEFWPNYLSACRSRGIPVVVANGRISDRGYRRARKIGRAMRWIYGMVTAFGMQTEEDADRAIALGAPEDRVQVLGQTKFDQEAQPLSKSDAMALKRELGWEEDAKVIVGGSTRPGEEAALLNVFGALRTRHPTLRLLLAPRHLERTEEIETLIRERGFTVGRRTRSVPGAELVLLDTMGELGKIYAVGDVCFVGGTLANIGGHNLLQPVAQGKPVFFGPHTQNVRDIAGLLVDEGVGFQADDEEELKRLVADALAHPEDLRALEKRALAVVEANRGASERYVDLLLAAIEGRA